MLKISNKLVPNFIAILFVFFIGIIIYVFFSYHDIFGCNRNFYKATWLVYLLGIPLLLYFVLKIIYRKLHKPFFFLFAIMCLGILGLEYRNKSIEDIINKDGGLLSLGIVKNKYSYYNDQNNIFVELISGKSNIYNFHVKDYVYSKLNENDTLVLLFSVNCKEWLRPYDFDPSPELIQKCKKGCFYKDGKIVDEL